MSNVQQIKTYIAEKGYTCADGLVENLYLSLKSRPFAFILGNSDTDMAKLPRLFAEAVGSTQENGHYLQLEVRPDWMDTSDLFGWLNLEGKFIPGVIIDFLKAAKEDPAHPYFLCLNHLILSRSEYYLRDVLNAVETRGQAQELPYVPTIYYGRDAEAKATYGEIPLLKNLYIVATVNLDETSLPLNQKLLDRTHTMSMRSTDMTGEPTGNPAPITPDADFLHTTYTALDQCQGTEPYFETFEEINKILMKATSYLGFKIRNEAILYLAHNRDEGVLPETKVMDHLICQKVLPRLQGNAKLIRPVMEDLLSYCVDKTYNQTATKLQAMIAMCDEKGYCSCWN